MNEIFSVVMPVYNVEIYLDKAIESILYQKIKLFELICIDDCSNDNSLEVLKKWECKDKRVKVYKNEKNKGLSETRNIGLDLAKGKYVLFVDSDDWIAENTLDVLYATINNFEVDILLFSSMAIDDDGNVVHEFYGKRDMGLFEICTGRDLIKEIDIKGNHCVTAWSALFRKDFLCKKHIRFKEGIIYEDNLFYFHTLMLAERVYTIDDVLYYYRYKRNGSITSNVDDIIGYRSSMVIIDEINKIIKENNINARDVIGVGRYLSSLYLRCITFFHKCVNGGKELERLSEWLDTCNYAFNAACLQVLDDRCYLSVCYGKYLRTIKTADHIYIYGAGKIGKKIAIWLSSNDIDNYKFVVSKRREVKYCMGNIVYEFKEVINELETAVVLIAVSLKYRDDVIRKLSYVNCKKIICLL